MQIILKLSRKILQQTCSAASNSHNSAYSACFMYQVCLSRDNAAQTGHTLMGSFSLVSDTSDTCFTCNFLKKMQVKNHTVWTLGSVSGDIIWCLWDFGCNEYLSIEPNQSWDSLLFCFSNLKYKHTKTRTLHACTCSYMQASYIHEWCHWRTTFIFLHITCILQNITMALPFEAMQWLAPWCFSTKRQKRDHGMRDGGEVLGTKIKSWPSLSHPRGENGETFQARQFGWGDKTVQCMMYSWDALPNW